jgi:hypothetical protein
MAENLDVSPDACFTQSHREFPSLLGALGSIE